MFSLIYQLIDTVFVHKIIKYVCNYCITLGMIGVNYYFKMDISKWYVRIKLLEHIKYLSIKIHHTLLGNFIITLL